jgi:purine-binding chemotaxis protein CheW
VASAGDAPPELERQLIMFSLHGEHYALPIASVREIIRYTPPKVTAAARGLIQGLINLRGRVLPVLDLSGRLGRVLEVSDTTRILVIEVANGVVGLVVDAVEGVVDVAVERIEPIPGADADDSLGSEIVAIEDHLVMLIDPDRALGQVLPEREAADVAPGDEAAAPETHESEPRRAPNPGGPHPGDPHPGGPPPARRRSAATPQMPRSRRRPGHPKDGEE